MNHHRWLLLFALCPFQIPAVAQAQECPSQPLVPIELQNGPAVFQIVEGNAYTFVTSDAAISELYGENDEVLGTFLLGSIAITADPWMAANIDLAAGLETIPDFELLVGLTIVIAPCPGITDASSVSPECSYVGLVGMTGSGSFEGAQLFVAHDEAIAAEFGMCYMATDTYYVTLYADYCSDETACTLDINNWGENPNAPPYSFDPLYFMDNVGNIGAPTSDSVSMPDGNDDSDGGGPVNGGDEGGDDSDSGDSDDEEDDNPLTTLTGAALMAYLFQYNHVTDNVSSMDVDQFSTMDFITAAIDAFDSCLQYCIVAIEIRVSWTYTGPHFYIVPVARHNMADFLVMTHPQMSKGPWAEWASTMGAAQYSLGSAVTRAFSKGVPMGGGEIETEDRGGEQAQTFKEGQVIGHPFAILPRIVGSNGEVEESSYTVTGHDGEEEIIPCETPDCLELENDALGNQLSDEQSGGSDQSANDAALDFMSNYMDGASDWSVLTDSSFTDIFVLTDTINMVAGLAQAAGIIAQLTEIAGTVQQFANSVPVDVAGGVSVSIQYLLCPNDVIPFMPYYASGADLLFWRSGFPITDANHAFTIGNPLSGDRIGAQNELWGHIYPRHGYLDQNWDSHAGAVMAVRAVDIPTRDDSYRIYLSAPGSSNGGGLWQKIHPEKSSCQANIANTGTENEQTGNYAWNYWRSYRCGLSKRGAFVTEIDISDVCF